MSKTLKDLNPNPRNPRKISDAKLESLKKALAEFGDLSGFVENQRTKRIVGGHQRQKALPPEAKLIITKKFEKPTKTGTIAVGFFSARGERFPYRLVDWSETKEKAANIAANKGGGEWDTEILSEWLKEIDDEGFDLDLTLFDETERESFLGDMDFSPGSEEDQGKLDEKKKTVCPHCGEEFLVGGRK